MKARSWLPCLAGTFGILAMSSFTGCAHVKPEPAHTSVREAIAGLRSAISRADWTEMSRLLPKDSRWSAQIEELVRTQQPDELTFSFWRKDSEVPLDSLNIRDADDGSVHVDAPLFVRGHRGLWSAVLDRERGQWRLRSTHELWGGSP